MDRREIIPFDGQTAAVTFIERGALERAHHRTVVGQIQLEPSSTMVVIVPEDGAHLRILAADIIALDPPEPPAGQPFTIWVLGPPLPGDAPSAPTPTQIGPFAYLGPAKHEADGWTDDDRTVWIEQADGAVVYGTKPETLEAADGSADLAEPVTCPSCQEQRARLIEVITQDQRIRNACDVCTAANLWDPTVKASAVEALDELIGYIDLIFADPETYAYRGHPDNALEEIRRRLELIAVAEA